MSDLTHADSIVINRSPEDLYDMVSDITRMGEWSPVTTSAWWDEGATAEVGAWFTGHNEIGERTWETRSQVIVADRGREFAFMVGGRNTRWGYTFEPQADGTTLVTESWAVQPAGVDSLKERFGDEYDARIEGARQSAHASIPKTLAAIKAAAEA